MEDYSTLHRQVRTDFGGYQRFVSIMQDVMYRVNDLFGSGWLYNIVMSITEKSADTHSRPVLTDVKPFKSVIVSRGLIGLPDALAFWRRDRHKQAERLSKITNDPPNPESWCIELEGHITRWDDTVEEWVRAENVPDGVIDQAFTVMERACNCRIVLRRLMPKKYGCNMGCSTRRNSEVSLSLMFDAPIEVVRRPPHVNTSYDSDELAVHPSITAHRGYLPDTWFPARLDKWLKERESRRQRN